MKTRKITALVLALAMIFALLPTSVFAETSGNGWTLDDDGTLTITSDAGMMDWWNNGKPNYSNDVTKLIIEAEVTNIPHDYDHNGIRENYSPFNIYYDEEGYEKGCTNLIAVEIKGNTSIGDYAFNFCQKLTTVTAENTASIGEKAFNYCSALKEISIPNVTTIGKSAFDECGSLTEIFLPKATSLGYSVSFVFSSCYNLKEVTFGSLESIENCAFMLCHGLTNINFTNAVPPETIADDAFESIKNDLPLTISFPCESAEAYEAAFAGKLNATEGAEVILAPAHTPTGEWITDETSHWHACTNCDEKADEAVHIPEADDGDCTTAVKCSVCGAETTAARPAHTGGKATTTKKAVCEVCGKEYGKLLSSGGSYTPPAKDDDETDQGVSDDPTIDKVLPDGTVIPGKKDPIITVEPDNGATKNPATGDSWLANLFSFLFN